MKKVVLSLVLAFSMTVSVMADINQIALNYNFNGIVHAGELGDPDNLDGYRSISDRGLNFTGGVADLSAASFGPYNLVSDSFVVDIVHLGNRNTVDVGGPGGAPFDDVVDGDNVGVLPNWLADPDQTGPQTTVLDAPIVLDGDSQAGFIFQISNGGGDFDVRFSFDSGDDVVATLSGPDWFGPGGGTPNIGTFAGTNGVDDATPEAPLLLTEGLIDLSAESGRTLTAITFENSTNPTGGIAILAANVSGTAVPEPTAAGLLIIGLAGFASRRRR